MDLDGNALLEAPNNGDMQTKLLAAGYSDFQLTNRPLKRALAHGDVADKYQGDLNLSGKS
ncbi:hypothetical protein [Sinorhizobium medicae]|uniref:hypothetical protein n=1 Tax=Sinorhizobium medicae TaxID=110321 RepID=UPI0012FC7267|nr:hypothetical protein [Sinorhizobium medicae]